MEHGGYLVERGMLRESPNGGIKCVRTSNTGPIDNSSMRTERLSWVKIDIYTYFDLKF